MTSPRPLAAPAAKRIGQRLASLCRLPALGSFGAPGVRGAPGAPAPCLPRRALLEPVAQALHLSPTALEDTFAEAARLGQNPVRRLAEVHKVDATVAYTALAEALGMP
ncbi:MAG TPA: hypothetical protein VN436_03870, partial [Holophaga sp.]|nr:hypothetical protein [Holophaga sp.]